MGSQDRKRMASVEDSAETLVTPGHPRWDEFLDRLTGPDGLDVRRSRWTCTGDEDKPLCRRILLAMGRSPVAVAANLRFFEHHGGYCDCEVWMNVEQSVDWGRPDGPWEDG